MAYPHLIDLYGKCNIGINHNVDMDCLGMDLFPFVQNEIPGGVLMFTLFRCPFFFSEGLQIFGFSLPETDQVWHSSNHRIFVF